MNQSLVDLKRVLGLLVLLSFCCFPELASAQLKLSQIELKGFLHIGDTVRVSLVDKIGQTSLWIEEGRFLGDVLVESIDADAMTVVLLQNGNRATLAFKKSKIVRLRNGPLTFDRNSDADISFDALQIMLFERGQELSSRSQTRVPES